jgi:cell division transport system permease protein
MMLNKCRYCFRTALQNIRRNSILTFLSISTIAVTFIVFVSFLLLLLNLSAVKKIWVERMQVIVFFKPSASVAALTMSRKEIEKMPEVETAQFISRDDALKFLRESLEGQDGLLEGLSSNPLPNSIEIKLRPQDKSIRSAEYEDFISRLRSLDGVDDIEYGQKWLDRFRVVIDMLAYTGICLGALLFLFTLFIISNTIRLMVYIRRDEIEIMRLVGATNLFIKMPFCFEGIIQGVCGAAAALLFVLSAQRLLLDKVAFFLNSFIGYHPLIGVNFTFSVYVLLLGALLGLTGSLLSIGSLDELQR